MTRPDHRAAVRYHAPTRPSVPVVGARAAGYVARDPLHGRLRPLLRGRQRTHSASVLLLVDAAAGLLARGVPQHLARAASGARQVRAVIPVDGVGRRRPHALLHLPPGSSRARNRGPTRVSRQEGRRDAVGPVPPARYAGGVQPPPARASRLRASQSWRALLFFLMIRRPPSLWRDGTPGPPGS